MLHIVEDINELLGKNKVGWLRTVTLEFQNSHPTYLIIELHIPPHISSFDNMTYGTISEHFEAGRCVYKEIIIRKKL